jgi:hypothetical protein
MNCKLLKKSICGLDKQHKFKGSRYFNSQKLNKYFKMPDTSAVPGKQSMLGKENILMDTDEQDDNVDAEPEPSDYDPSDYDEDGLYW